MNHSTFPIPTGFSEANEGVLGTREGEGVEESLSLASSKAFGSNREIEQGVFTFLMAPRPNRCHSGKFGREK